MFRSVVFLTFIINITVSLENITTTDDHILCRNCGAVISTSKYIFSKKSSNSQYEFEDTLFGREKVLVQVLRSDFFFNFVVITTEHSTCVTIGEWEESEYWFPGYCWKLCMCPACGTYVGWVFEPVEYNSIVPDRNFFGLILTNLIGDACNYFLVIILGSDFCQYLYLS